MLLQTTQKFGFRFQRRDIEQTIEATSKMWFWQLKSFQCDSLELLRLDVCVWVCLTEDACQPIVMYVCVCECC